MTKFKRIFTKRGAGLFGAISLSFIAFCFGVASLVLSVFVTSRSVKVISIALGSTSLIIGLVFQAWPFLTSYFRNRSGRKGRGSFEFTCMSCRTSWDEDEDDSDSGLYTLRSPPTLPVHIEHGSLGIVPEYPHLVLSGSGSGNTDIGLNLVYAKPPNGACKCGKKAKVTRYAKIREDGMDRTLHRAVARDAAPPSYTSSIVQAQADVTPSTFEPAETCHEQGLRRRTPSPPSPTNDIDDFGAENESRTDSIHSETFTQSESTPLLPLNGDTEDRLDPDVKGTNTESTHSHENANDCGDNDSYTGDNDNSDSDDDYGPEHDGAGVGAQIQSTSTRIIVRRNITAERPLSESDVQHRDLETSVQSGKPSTSLNDISHGLAEVPTWSALPTYTFPLNKLCDLIDRHPNVSNAEIVRTHTCVYQKAEVSERCLVIEVCGGESNHIWLRLDHRPTRTVGHVARFRADANSQGTFGRSCDVLFAAERYTRESTQVFFGSDSSVTLRDLSQFLQALESQVTKYTLVSRNCWSFCSVVEEYFMYNGETIHVVRNAKHQDSARGARASIQGRLAAGPDMKPPSIRASLKTLPTPTVGEATISSWFSNYTVSAPPQSTKRAKANRPAQTSASHCPHLFGSEMRLALIRSFICEYPDGNRAREDHAPNADLGQSGSLLSLASRSVNDPIVLLNEAAQLLHKRNPSTYNSDLVDRICDYRTPRHEPGRYVKACQALAELVAFTRYLHERDPIVYESDLVDRLREYGALCHKTGRYDEACKVLAESVEIFRRLCEQKTVAHLPNLADGLRQYGISLGNAGRHNEACRALAESVHISRRLCEQNPNAHMPNLADGLRQYGISLGNAGRHNEACRALAESAGTFRRLCQQNLGAYDPELAQWLQTYARALTEVGNSVKDDEVRAELVALTEQHATD